MVKRRVLLVLPRSDDLYYFTDVITNYISELKRVTGFEVKSLVGDEARARNVKNVLESFNPHYIFFLGHGRSCIYTVEKREVLLCTEFTQCTESGCRGDASSHECTVSQADWNEMCTSWNIENTKLLKDKVVYFLSCCFGNSGDYLTTCWPWYCPVGVRGFVGYCDLYWFYGGGCAQLPGLVELHGYYNIALFTFLVKGDPLNEVVGKAKKIVDIFMRYTDHVVVPEPWEACVDYIYQTFDKDIKALIYRGSNFDSPWPVEGPSEVSIEDINIRPTPFEIPVKDLEVKFKVRFNRELKCPGVLITWYNYDNWFQDITLHLISPGTKAVEITMRMNRLHIRLFGNVQPYGRGTIPKSEWGKVSEKYLEVKAYLIY